MEACNFPEIDEHRDQHHILSTQIYEREDEWRKRQSPEITDHLRKFLTDWLVDRIQNIGTKIGHYTKGEEQDIMLALEKIETAGKFLPVSKYSIVHNT
ncbi:MAG: hypothetical protein H8E36_04560 [Rhodospirillaceae bacterium]|nr:hypothetical protein [Rhodospirillaceae bacterium]